MSQDQTVLSHSANTLELAKNYDEGQQTTMIGTYSGGGDHNTIECQPYFEPPGIPICYYVFDSVAILMPFIFLSVAILLPFSTTKTSVLSDASPGHPTLFTAV